MKKTDALSWVAIILSVFALALILIKPCERYSKSHGGNYAAKIMQNHQSYAKNKRN